jgi:alkylhydroperoxidase family enzyme
MARVPYIDAIDGVSPPELVALYADIAGLRGSVVNLYRALGNQPAALRAFMGMSRYIRDDADLPANLRELAVLATGYALDAAYEIHHHVPIARRVGVSEAQLAAFPDWAASDAFDDTERAVVAYADQVARTRTVEDDTWAALQERLPRGQLIDLALTVGWYHLCAAVLGPLRIETEEAAPGPTALG